MVFSGTVLDFDTEEFRNFILEFGFENRVWDLSEALSNVIFKPWTTVKKYPDVEICKYL